MIISFVMGIHITLLTWCKGRLVGTDDDGNRYYEDKYTPTTGAGSASKKQRRWVIYKGLPEASKVSASWHGWLHYVTDVPPTQNGDAKPWQKPYAPNTTGTVLAYKPKGFARTGRFTPTSSYEPWDPAC